MQLRNYKITVGILILDLQQHKPDVGLGNASFVALPSFILTVLFVRKYASQTRRLEQFGCAAYCSFRHDRGRE